MAGITVEENSMEVQGTIENDAQKKETTSDIIDQDVSKQDTKSDIIDKDVHKKDTDSGGGCEPLQEAVDDKNTSILNNNVSIPEAEDGKNTSVLQNNVSIPEAPNDKNTSVLHNDESILEASEDKNTSVLQNNVSIPEAPNDKNTSVLHNDESILEASEDKNTSVLNDNMKSMPDASDCKNTSELIDKPDASDDGKTTSALGNNVNIPNASNIKDSNKLNDNMNNTLDLSDDKNTSVLIDNMKNSQDASDAEDAEDLKFENEEDDLDDVIQSGESFWCSLCDDGGNLLFCDGPCLRSFHAYLTEEEKEEGKDCPTLGFTEEIFQAMENKSSTWLCPNCEANRQQCFICGKLGISVGPKKEVFNCDAAHCGQFYHLHCVAQRITRNPTKQQAYINGIKEGVDTFLCPLHKCRSCKKLEDGTEKDMQFAKCRRCPSGWHVQCLPAAILFEEDADLDIPQRAWRVPVGEGEQFRVGIYCLEHELPLEPSQMVKFPHSPLSKQKNRSNSQHELKRRKQNTDIDIASSGTQFSPREQSKLSKRGTKICESANLKGERKKKTKLDAKISAPPNFPICTQKSPIVGAAVHVKANGASSKLVQDIRKRIDLIISKSQTLKNVEDVKQLLRTPMFYGDNSQKKFAGEGGKFIHDGKLISILNSVPKALACLTGGDDTLAHAKCLCSMQSIVQLDRVQKALKVFLNPCLHGLRYTSFGRHFTTKTKLIEVVERLHWYIEDKDMVVDFCCGANEFSTEISQKLIDVGKKHCKYKNYDILAPKNDFQFEQKDWFAVQPHDLPSGDRLIMGLNPPFGVRAAIANPFIKHAVMFRPKIIILIVPPVTKSLVAYGYELIWEDPLLLKGKSFYLPGSLNTEDATLEDWNIKPPPLYLWSRSDWADKHRAIAKQQGHTTPWTLPLYIRPKKERSLSPLLSARSTKQPPHKAEASIKQEPAPKPTSLPLDEPKNQPLDKNSSRGTICKSDHDGGRGCSSTRLLDVRQRHEVPMVPRTDKITDQDNHDANILPAREVVGDQPEEKDSKKRNRAEECDNHVDVPDLVHRDSKESKKSRDHSKVREHDSIQPNKDAAGEQKRDGRRTEGANGGTYTRNDGKDTNGPRMTNETRVDRSSEKNERSGSGSRRTARVHENLNARCEIRPTKELNDKVEPNHQKHATDRRIYDRDRQATRKSFGNSKDFEKNDDKMRFKGVVGRQGHYINKPQDRKRGFENGETRSQSPRKKPRVDETNRKSYRDFLRSTLHVELPKQTSDPYTNVASNVKTSYYGVEDNMRGLRHRNDSRVYEKELDVTNDDRRRRSSRRSRSFDDEGPPPGTRYNNVDPDLSMHDAKNNNRASYPRQQDSTLPKWFTMKPGAGGGGFNLGESDKVNMLSDRVNTPSDANSPPRKMQVARPMDIRERGLGGGVHDPSPRQRFATQISEFCGRSDHDFDRSTYCDSYATKFLDFLEEPVAQDITLGNSVFEPSGNRCCYTDHLEPSHPDIYASQFSNYGHENQYQHEPCSWKSSSDSIVDMHHQPQDPPSTQLNFDACQYGCLDNVYPTGYTVDTLIPRSRVEEPFFPADQRFMHASDTNFDGMSLVGPQMSQGLNQNGILSRPILPRPYPTCGDYSQTENLSILSSEPLYRSSLFPSLSQQDTYVSGMAPSQPWHEPLMFSHTMPNF